MNACHALPATRAIRLRAPEDERGGRWHDACLVTLTQLSWWFQYCQHDAEEDLAF